MKTYAEQVQLLKLKIYRGGFLDLWKLAVGNVKEDS